MKLVRCMLTLENWEKIVCSLRSVVVGMTVHCTREISPETNRKATYRGLEYEVYLPCIVLEILTDDSWLENIIATISRAHSDGLITGRAIQVLPVEASYRVRDGFMDTA